MVKDREFYKQFFSICIVIVLQNIITLSVNLADNLMLGSYLESALAGATAVNQIQFIYQQILMGIADGLVIFGSQYWGKKQTGEIKKLSSITLTLGVGVMILFFLCATFFTENMVQIFTNDTAIVEQGVAYLSISRYSYIFFCFTYLLLATLRSVQVVKIAFYLSVSTLIINCSINWVLIYGRFGFPELGIRGAAIGTLIARIVELIILLCYITWKEKILQLKITDYFVFDRQLFKGFIKIAAPIILISSLWGVNTAAQTAILGHLSSSAITANSVASNLFLLLKTAAVGTASATSIIIGKTIGENKLDKVHEYAKTFQIMFVILGVTCGLLLFVLIEPVLALYGLSAESDALARSFLRVLCFVIAFMSYQMPTNAGLIRGGGDTKYMMKLDLISIYGVVLPIAFFVAFVVKANPVIVVICLNLDQFFKVIPAYIKVNRLRNWVHILTKEKPETIETT